MTVKLTTGRHGGDTAANVRRRLLPMTAAAVMAFRVFRVGIVDGAG